MIMENAFLFGIIGAFIGSFLNVIAYRLPRGESFVLPPSHCPHCQHRLGAFDLIPLLSFMGLRGRCRYCRYKISWRYPLVELATGFITLLWWLGYGQNGLNGQNIVFLVLCYVLIVIALIDIDCHVIPDQITIPFTVIELGYQAVIGNLWGGIIGFIVGGGVLLLIYLVYSRGMGLGDVKLLAMTGAFIGWEKALVVLFFGSVLGVAIMLPMLMRRQMNRKTPFAFGPFLVLATFSVIYRWDLFVKILPFLPR